LTQEKNKKFFPVKNGGGEKKRDSTVWGWTVSKERKM